MKVYTVHARENQAPEDDPMGAVFVKEGFCWPALFFAIPWMIFRRMWLVLVLYVAAVAGLIAVGRMMPDETAGLIALLFIFWFALEANQFRRWRLSRAGYRMVGIAEGSSLFEAEARYFSNLPPPARPSIDVTSVPVVPRQPPESGPPVVGLFPAPGSAA